MTAGPFDLTRRTVLAGLGTVGVASAGADFGTSAYFSDGESFTGNQLVAGELDMKMAYSTHYSDWSADDGEGVEVRMWDGPAGTTGGPGDQDDGETGLPTSAAWLVAVDHPDQFLANTQYASDGTASCDGGTDSGSLAQPVIQLEDVKPGDFGEVTFDVALCDTPGYLWLQGELVDCAENGVTEPAGRDPDEDDTPSRDAASLGALAALAGVSRFCRSTASSAGTTTAAARPQRATTRGCSHTTLPTLAPSRRTPQSSPSARQVFPFVRL